MGIYLAHLPKSQENTIRNFLQYIFLDIVLGPSGTLTCTNFTSTFQVC